MSNMETKKIKCIIRFLAKYLNILPRGVYCEKATFVDWTARHQQTVVTARDCKNCQVTVDSVPNFR